MPTIHLETSLWNRSGLKVELLGNGLSCVLVCKTEKEGEEWSPTGASSWWEEPWRASSPYSYEARESL